jgi:hypothetical protein
MTHMISIELFLVFCIFMPLLMLYVYIMCQTFQHIDKEHRTSFAEHIYKWRFHPFQEPLTCDLFTSAVHFYLI